MNKMHFIMNYGTSPPYIWSTCSRNQLAQSASLSSLLKKPEKFIDLSKVSLLGQVYSADKQCEMEMGPGFTLHRPLHDSNNQCKELSCSTNGSFVDKSRWGMFDFTPCGIGKMCYDNDCIEETQLTPIHGGWGQWIPTGNCSRSCGIGIVKASRKCNNPLPEYGGDYCVGKKVRFEICSVKPCPKMAVDFRQQQCSKLNNDTTNFTAVYDPKDTENLCKLTCQAVEESNDSIILGNVIDGTLCGNDSHDVDYMCNNGECKRIGCTENDNVFDANSILDICNVSRGFYSNQDALDVETRSQSLGQLLYELPENWTLNNSCIIIYRMKKNWELVMDYFQKEKSDTLKLATILKYIRQIIKITSVKHTDIELSLPLASECIF
ncbi:hypothetical protein HCN44_000806 [Aphidius gifuensis]|uniref:ADAMTS cysteine-rich domain-containing protein n=1 Tax=Aphidius gifuensis TaxID=684658 RepID=A0A834XQE9_APHGI|nr:hypothetical protein HCN44_000806 [Aphidius gifuensis]